MHRMRLAARRAVLAAALVAACTQPGRAADTMLQGSWTAIEAVSDGKPADDLVGHRLDFAGDRFTIEGKDGASLYAGTVRVDSSAQPAAIDFEHNEGALAGKAWLGIYAVEGNTLTICDNAPNMEKSRPAAFEAGERSGYVLFTFERQR